MDRNSDPDHPDSPAFPSGILDTEQVKDKTLSFGRNCVDITIRAAVVDFRVCIHLIQNFLVVPVFALLWGNAVDDFLQWGENDQGDEIHEEPSLHHLVGVNFQAITVDTILHVIKEQFDVISLPDSQEYWSCVLRVMKGKRPGSGGEGKEREAGCRKSQGTC
ncbi:MAG: hypothetical protein JXK93_05030 [Sphaerochaetaceae bacterium]|nr:hypothetical protein [Sphaerochaetaceae bacterium]